MKKKKMKLILTILIILLLGVIGIYIYINYFNKEKEVKFDNTIYYNNYVKTKNIASLYIKENNNYIKKAKIGLNIEIELKENKNKTDKYFNIKKFDNEYYINYEDITKIDSINNIDDRYKKYILFNKNVVTKEKTNFYDKDNNLIYSFDKEFSLPLIINDNDKYGVEFDNQLLYIMKNESDLVDNHNTDKKNSSGVGVLNYHFFYDENDKEATKKCNSFLCVSKSQLNSEIDFFEQNDIMSIKMNELEMYIDGKINLPKSVLITIDDGPTNTVGLELLTKRKQYATVFLITSWFDPKSYYKSDYIELHSHGDNLHEQYRCKEGLQGGAIQCEPKEKLLKDLMTSREKLDGSTAFAYPFYEYNDYSIEVLKEAGFTMAFEGEKARRDNLVKPGMDKFRLPRFVMVNYTSKNDLQKYFSKIK